MRCTWIHIVYYIIQDIRIHSQNCYLSTILTFVHLPQNYILGKARYKKTVKKVTLSPFGDPLPPPLNG